MARTPLRAAFWTLCTSIGLSISLLTAGVFSGRTRLPPPASFGGVERSDALTERETPVGPSILSSSADSTSASSTADVANSRPTTEPITPSGSVAVPFGTPGSGSIPVNVVSHPAPSALAIGLEETLHPASGNGEFIELPPPPEFDTAPVAATPPESAPDLDELVDRLQTRFDGLQSNLDRLHGEFAGIDNQFAGLQSLFAGELASVQSSQQKLRETLSELVGAYGARQPVPPPLEIDMMLLLMPLRGDARHGTLRLLSQNHTDISCGPEIAPGTRWATCLNDAATVADWLRKSGAARTTRRSTLQLEQKTEIAIDLTQSIAPGMIQARGRQIVERVVTTPWPGPLRVRAVSGPSGLLDMEFNIAAEWKKALLRQPGTLILTIQLEEVCRPTQAIADSGWAAPHRPAGTEMIVLLEPRLSTTSPLPVPRTADRPASPLPEESMIR